MYKNLFLADIDGTLVRTNAPLSAAVKNAAEHFTSMGGSLSVCTGRPPVSTVKIAEQLGITAPGIVFGGGMIYDFARKAPVWSMCMKAEVLDIVQTIWERHPKVALLAYSADRIYTLRANRRLRERGVKEESQGEECDIRECRGDLQKIVLIGDDVDELVGIGEQYVDAEQYAYAFASRHFAEITHKKVNKGTALRKLAQLCGIPLANIFAAGDAMTDLPMLQAAGTSFAMGCAPEEVRRCATYVVETPEEDGMKTAFEIAAGLLA